MASKTFGDMFNKVVRQVGLTNTFNDGAEETQSIKEDINDIQKEILSISKTYLTKEGILISGGTVANQNNYDIPATIDKVTNLKITTGGVDYYPNKISIFQFQKLSNTNENSDIPIFWTIDKNQIYIYPTPTSNLIPIEVNANTLATNLTTDPSVTTDQNTSLGIKEGYENVIYYYALIEAFARLEDYASADRYQVKYEKLEKRYMNEVRTTSNSIVIGGRKEYVDPNYYNRLTY